jgi:hypothetical protein
MQCALSLNRMKRTLKASSHRGKIYCIQTFQKIDKSTWLVYSRQKTFYVRGSLWREQKENMTDADGEGYSDGYLYWFVDIARFLPQIIEHL